jgi:ACR3 family arsenite efflux pump ArsB
MVLGVLLGNLVPGIGGALAFAHVADVSLPIALGLWLMMWCAAGPAGGSARLGRLRI